MYKKSAGILLYQFDDKNLKVMLVHPGGPFWTKKDDGAWSIPKGEFEENEEALTTAKREFEEELGRKVSAEKFIELKPVKSKNRKTVYAFAAEQDFDATNIKSNFCMIDWPPRSGKQMEIPEIDKAAWFDYETAKKKIISYQLPLLDELFEKFKK